MSKSQNSNFLWFWLDKCEKFLIFYIYNIVNLMYLDFEWLVYKSTNKQNNSMPGVN